MFYHFPQDFKEFRPAPGFLVRVVSGRGLMLSHVTLEPNSEAPLHSHAEEQMGIILDGEFEMTIGDETRLLKKGDMYLVPSGTTHGGVTHAQPALILDAFSPPREAYR
ncbi:MAG TPA: cupin domain-containing protein [Dehalococcoidia bacterium]|jgi:quercetin dioxygenase-like cupin family protein|nr:cupin domain-containing protein [Dehalococcoidia bacterium]